jgi:hypothetical protein
MDWKRQGRRQTIQLWDENMENRFNSEFVNESEMNKRVYSRWAITGPRY